jgi:hypothetical protein
MPAAPTFQAVCTSECESPTMTTRSGLTPTCSASSRNPPGSGLGASPSSPQLMPSTHPASASVSSSNVVGLLIIGREYSDLDSGGGQPPEGTSHIADRNHHSLSCFGDLLYDATTPLVPKIAQRRHHSTHLCRHEHLSFSGCIYRSVNYRVRSASTSRCRRRRTRNSAEIRTRVPHCDRTMDAGTSCFTVLQ